MMSLSSLFYIGQFNGSTPSACWNKIYRKLRKKKINSSDGLSADGGVVKNYESGYDMFGFSSPEVMKLIKVKHYIIFS